MPEQTNQAKLAQYIVTLKEQLAVLSGECGQGNLPSISAAKIKEYAEQIELAALKLNADEMPGLWESPQDDDDQLDTSEASRLDLPAKVQDDQQATAASYGLRKRISSRKESGSGQGTSVKMDASTLDLIEKHRHLQEGLTDELVELARQMKDTSHSMSQAVRDSEKVLDSTEHGIEHSLASTNQANIRAKNIYSKSIKTGCLTWLIIFVMCCMFLLMVFLIRIT